MRFSSNWEVFLRVFGSGFSCSKSLNCVVHGEMEAIAALGIRTQTRNGEREKEDDEVSRNWKKRDSTWAVSPLLFLGLDWDGPF